MARFLSECVAFLCNVVIQTTPTNATISSQLLQGTSVGILVKRVVGKRLALVGRVPFGMRKRGRNRIKWNLEVNGTRLSRGTYEVTLRALDAKGKVFDLSRPVRIVVR